MVNKSIELLLYYWAIIGQFTLNQIGIKETFENFSFLLIVDPGRYILNRFPVTDHLAGRKIPVGIPDGNGDDDPWGLT
jgi:hypothetical protein